MKLLYLKAFFIVALSVSPFLTNAQITGGSSVCAGASTSLTDANTGGVWSSSDNAIGTVDGSGNVTGIAAGTVDISYIYTDISFALQTDIVTVTVNPLPDAGTIAGSNTVCVGATTPLSDASAGGVWASNAAGIATVDAFGVMSGVVAGNTTISYIVTNGCGSAYTTLDITVNPLPVTGTITGTNTMCSGSGVALTDAAIGGVWSSNDNLTAIVDASGNVNGMAAGNTTISYSVTNGCGTLSATKAVTVYAIPVSITGTPRVCEQANRTLSDAVTGGIWTSANTGTATVNSTSGKVTGVLAGSVNITYTLTGGCYTVQNVTVNPLPVAGTISGSGSLTRGSSNSLTDIGANGPGTWISCNALIASVDASGNITGVANGVTLISYSVTNTCGTKVATIKATVGDCVTATNISTFAGSHVNGTSGDGGTATAAQIGSSYGVAADGVGNVYISDYLNSVVRKVDASGTITTIAGIAGSAGYNGDNIAAATAQLNGPQGLTLDGSNHLYIADKFNERIRKVNLLTGIITTVAGTGNHGGWQGYDYGNGGAATSANLDYPVSVALDCGGNMYIADWGSQTVRKVNKSGIISKFAGTYGGGYNGDGIQANSAQLNSPSGVAADCSGNVYIADSWNNRIRKVNASGIITTIAGNGNPTYAGDGGPATSASLWIPNSVTLDACGNMYICDWQNNVVRKLGTDGNISTFAGKNANDWHGYNGDGGPADTAYMYLPSNLAIDGLGNIYIADYGNYVVRAMADLSYTARMFANGTTQSMTVCQNATASINDLMAIPDATGGMTETWNISRQPSHGTLAGFNATATSRNGITTPSGLTYTPEAGYTGTDDFTIVMSDGTTASSTTVNVNVNPLPNAGVITGATNVTDGNTIALADATGDANGVWSSDNTLIATVDATGNVTGIGNGLATISYTATNNCGSTSATTGIVIASENMPTSKAMLFPNPNNGSFQCEINSETDCQLELNVSDVTGRVVHKQTIDAITGLNVVKVNLPATIQKPSVLTVSIGNKHTKYPAVKITVTE